MTKLQTLAVAALMGVASAATAQTSISQEEGISSELSTYLTVEEKMTATEKNIKELTNELLADDNSDEKEAIRAQIKSEQKTLIELRRAHEERKALKPGNRSVTLFEGDLTKNDLNLKSFKTGYDATIEKLTISFRAENNDQVNITVLTPGKEIVHQTESTATTGKHKLEVSIPAEGIKTYCVNIESNGKTVTKMISL